MNTIKVAVAVITDEDERILVTQRSLNNSQGGLWEFPGGKLESDETAEQALIREVREELGVEVLSYAYLGEHCHQYPSKKIQLIIFHVTEFAGKPTCLEDQLGLRWLAKAHFNLDEFPEANRAVFDLIEL
jgi:8-oxo-dGTP diphosphatase